MACYAGVIREEATEKLAQNSLFAAQFIFHYAMEIAKGNMYWQDGMPSDTNGFQEEYDVWYKQTKEKYHLNEEYEMIKFKDKVSKEC